MLERIGGCLAIRPRAHRATPPHTTLLRYYDIEVTDAGKATCEGKPKQMPLLQVIITLIVVGILLWLVNRFIPMAPSIRSILNAVVVIAVVVWILNVFGLLAFLSNIHVGKPSP